MRKSNSRLATAKRKKGRIVSAIRKRKTLYSRGFDTGFSQGFTIGTAKGYEDGYELKYKGTLR